MRVIIGLVAVFCCLGSESRANLITGNLTGQGRAVFFALDLNTENSLWNFQANERLNFAVNESFEPVGSYRASASASMSESYLADSLSQSLSSQFSITLPDSGFVLRNIAVSATSFFWVQEPVKGVLDFNFGFANTSEYFANFFVATSDTGTQILSGDLTPGSTQVEFTLSPGGYQLGIGYSRNLQGTHITVNESHSAFLESQLNLTSLSSVPEPSSLFFAASTILLGVMRRISRRPRETTAR